ncbi:MAG: HD domain-containing protein [bacterium]|nr:HD domain-containing protein [bacterium]
MNALENRRQHEITTAATLLVDEFVTALVNSRIYQLEHPRLQNSLSRVLDHVQTLTTAMGSERVRIASHEGMMFFGGKPLLGASIAAARLIEVLDAWRAGGFEIARQASRDQLAVFFACILARPEPMHDNHAAINSLAAQRQCIHVTLLPPVGDGADDQGSHLGPGSEVDGQGGSAAGDDPKARAAVKTYQSLMDTLQAATVSVCRGGQIDFSPVMAQAEAVLKHLETDGAGLLGLARQDQYDAFTLGHSLRVAILAMNFARALTADRELQIRIGAAALLHDVGKSLVPFELLHCNRRLDAEEQREMSKHAELGARCLLDHHDSDPLAIAAAFGHHLALDGTGYPSTVHDHPISWITSVVKICDIYEALTAARPYKTAMPPIRAYRIMIAMGERLDQGLLKRFIEINGIYPVGQTVELAEGAIAIVAEQTDDPMHPIVNILRDSDGDNPDPDDNEPFDLREVACPNVRIILREVLGTVVDQAPERDAEPAAD